MPDVVSICRNLEHKHGIKILFAIESGSRVWRMESADSDYDIRFVYRRDFKEYLQLKKPDDVIEYIEGDIDVSGFDIFKFCSMLASSNPTIIEWLESDILYWGEKPVELINIARTRFKQSSLFYHYQNYCKNNYVKFIQSDNAVTHKKYLYALRGLVNALWVQHKNSVPPIIFSESTEALAKEKLLPQQVAAFIAEAIEVKKTGQEKNVISRNKEVDAFIEHFLSESISVEANPDEETTRLLNNFILKVLI